MDDKQQINLMAAGLCGYNPLIGRLSGRILVRDGECPETEDVFDIFADTPQGAWCREQVVKALGERSIYILPVFDEYQEGEDGLSLVEVPTYLSYWGVFKCPDQNKVVANGGTYPEAVAAAVKHVSKENYS